MIELRLQMFGTGSIGAHKGGGGGSKSTSKQAVSNNAPGSGRGSGGNKQAGGGATPKNEEKYNLYSIRGDKTRLYQTGMTMSDLKEILGGHFKVDKKTNTIITKTGKKYKLTKTKTTSRK